jgi:transcriptional regulator with XRE-family HTH domain
VKRTHKGPLRDVLAKNMRRLRAARGLTQEALAYDSGINRTYLSAVERAERNVSIDNIARIVLRRDLGNRRSPHLPPLRAPLRSRAAAPR